MKLLRVLTLFCIVAGLSACSTFQQSLVADKAERKTVGEGFTLAAPTGWVYGAGGPQPGNVFNITRDGPRVNFIMGSLRAAGEAFPQTQRGINERELPTTWVQAYVEEFRKAANLPTEPVIVSTIPVRIDGAPGFETQFEYKTARGLTIRVKAYGFMTKRGFGSLRFEAPALIYYDKHVADFDAVVRSVALTK